MIYKIHTTKILTLKNDVVCVVPSLCFLLKLFKFVKGTVAPDEIGLKVVWLDRP